MLPCLILTCVSFIVQSHHVCFSVTKIINSCSNHMHVYMHDFFETCIFFILIGVGKTSILHQFLGNGFVENQHTPTVGKIYDLL